MTETVSGSRYPRLHHRLSESSWNRLGVRRQRMADAPRHFGYASALVIDESAFAKKVGHVGGAGSPMERAAGQDGQLSGGPIGGGYA